MGSCFAWKIYMNSVIIDFVSSCKHLECEIALTSCENNIILCLYLKFVFIFEFRYGI